MPRPYCWRRIGFKPVITYFKPEGMPLSTLEEIVLTLDELEALRLADLNSLYQEQAAEKMGISRSTFARLIENAHKKVAEALVNGKAIRIEGGHVIHDDKIQYHDIPKNLVMEEKRRGPYGKGCCPGRPSKPNICPRCGMPI